MQIPLSSPFPYESHAKFFINILIYFTWFQWPPIGFGEWCFLPHWNVVVTSPWDSLLGCWSTKSRWLSLFMFMGASWLLAITIIGRKRFRPAPIGLGWWGHFFTSLQYWCNKLMRQSFRLLKLDVSSCFIITNWSAEVLALVSLVPRQLRLARVFCWEGSVRCLISRKGDADCHQ